MAIKQTRRTVSFNRKVHAELKAMAAKAGVSIAEFIVSKLLEAGLELSPSTFAPSKLAPRFYKSKKIAERVFPDQTL